MGVLKDFDDFASQDLLAWCSRPLSATRAGSILSDLIRAVDTFAYWSERAPTAARLKAFRALILADDQVWITMDPPENDYCIVGGVYLDLVRDGVIVDRVRCHG